MQREQRPDFGVTVAVGLAVCDGERTSDQHPRGKDRGGCRKDVPLQEIPPLRLVTPE